MTKNAAVKEGDKVYVVDASSYAIAEKEVKSAPSLSIIWIGRTGSGNMMVGEARWDKTKAGAITKAIALATNKRQELTDRIRDIDAVLKKLNA